MRKWILCEDTSTHILFFIAPTTVKIEKRNEETDINYNFRRRKRKSAMCVKYDPRYDPDAWYVKPSPNECKPAWTFPANRPFITHSSTVTLMKVSNLHELGSDLQYIIPGHSYMQQGVRVHIFLNEFLLNQTNNFLRF